MKPVLLIVDDDEEIRSQMRWALTEDYQIQLGEDKASALSQWQAQPAPVVLLDLGLPPNPANPQEGLATLTDLLTLEPKTKIIIVTGQNEKPIALEAIARGAYDFLTKPVDMDELKTILKRAFYLAHLERENDQIKSKLLSGAFENMLGTSPAMQAVFNAIQRVAHTDAPVLILGESGTGKEMAAMALHQRSPRKDGPFIAINCGAIPENLLESELFGHEKGAFTGAHAQRQGRIELADGGTLFLDEIGELPAALQVKLLRFLQESHIERLGGRREIPINTRVLAATNADLSKALASGAFREDLYYRLAVVVMKLPPLRERVGDTQLVAQALLQKYAKAYAKKAARFSQDALRALEQHPWPGNVRELENRVKRAVIMAEGATLNAADLDLATVTSPAPGRTLKEAREALERNLVLEALKRQNGNVSAVAVELGISRPTLYELMEKLAIQRP